MTGSTSREPSRTPLGSGFIRSLSALTGIHAPAPRDAFAQSLSQWFDWTHAISLAAALSGAPARAAGAGAAVRAGASADERELVRVHAKLTTLIAETLARPTADFAAWRHAYAVCQQAMAAEIGPLRQRVRATVMAGSPTQKTLGELDAVVEQALGTKERTLLSTVADKLRPRFERLQQAAELAIFRQELQALLLAELDLRLQPVEALLDAFRPSRSNRHD